MFNACDSIAAAGKLFDKIFQQKGFTHPFESDDQQSRRFCFTLKPAAASGVALRARARNA